MYPFLYAAEQYSIRQLFYGGRAPSHDTNPSPRAPAHRMHNLLLHPLHYRFSELAVSWVGGMSD